MHEIHLAEDLLVKIKEKAKARGLSKVSKIKVKVGEMHTVGADELKFGFEMISKGNIIEGAIFEVEITPLAAKCSKCSKEIKEKTLKLDCPNCGSPHMEIVSGKELLVESIE